MQSMLSNLESNFRAMFINCLKVDNLWIAKNFIVDFPSFHQHWHPIVEGGVVQVWKNTMSISH